MSSVVALVSSGVSRVVIGLLHPLAHLRGQAVRTLKAAGISVDVLQPDPAAQGQAAQQCMQACLQVNEVDASSPQKLWIMSFIWGTCIQCSTA